MGYGEGRCGGMEKRKRVRRASMEQGWSKQIKLVINIVGFVCVTH